MSDFMHEKIAVIGIGSTGCGVIDNMIDQGTQGIEFIGVSIGKSCACLSENKIQILDYKKNYNTKKEEKEVIEEGLGKIKKIIDKTDMIFILSDTIGYDGGRIAKDISKLCKSMGILTIAIVNDPLKIEHKDIKKYGEIFKNNLEKSADAVIVLPSDKIIKATGLNFLSVNQMYSLLEDHFVLTIKSIADILIKTGEIHIVFEDLKYLFKDQGVRNISMVHGLGDGGTKKAFSEAIKDFGPVNKLNKIIFIFTFPEDDTTMQDISKVIKSPKIDSIMKKDGIVMCAIINDEIKGYNGNIRVTILGM